MSGVWTCPRNHRWRPSATDSTTLDAVQPCPVCGEPGTLADAGSADTPADDVTLSRGYAPRPVPAAEVHIPGYAVTAEIGRGAMGVVYRATETALNRPVALKMILAGAHAGGRDVARFRREVGAVAALRHPNIVQIYALGEAGGLPFCALELVEGGTLAERLKKQGPLDPRVAARLVADLARAVHFAHERGIVHRDLKPANVLLDGDGRPKIADFGLAKLGGDSSLTGSAAVLGTPAYMAPEQAGDGKAVGPAADVHGLGAILYELLTGRPPFKAGSALETLQQVLHDDAAPVRRARPDVPKDLETITLKCLEKDPGRRYASAAALADDLERFLAGEPVTARPLGGAARAVRWAGRHRPALVGAAAATAVTLLVVSLWPEPAGDAGHPHAGTGRETATTGAAEDAELVVRVGDRTGPGSLYFERGVVLTSTDLLGMAAKDSPPPARVEVVYHPGRPDERTYPAEVVSAEPAVKVAVLRLKGDRLPDPPPQPGVAVAAAPAQPATADSKLAVRSGSGAGGRKAGLEAAAAAVVQVRLTRDGKEATAPGFFAGPPGVVATAAVAPADAVTVAVHAGMPAERVLPARVLAVDHDAALAVLRVDGDDLPPPLPLAPSGRMREGQKLHAVAAPVAGRPAAIEPAALTGRIMSRNGGTRYLQVETAKVGPGTPVVDGAGRLVGVAHAVLGGTRLHFLTPADEVERLLDGRLLTVTPSQPVAADGGTTVPVTARLADPLGRVKAVALAVWAGDPTGVVKPATGAARPAEITAARIVGLRLAGDPNPLDGRLAEGDVPLPTMTLLQVAWVRPRYTAVDG
ncbi:MAG TPA: protein kinase, partial [Gemmataceae bacterium]